MDSSFSATQIGSLGQHRRLSGKPRSASFKVILVQALFFFYKFIFGPFIHAIGGAGFGCRHEPSCSEYTKEQFLKKPLFHAIWNSSKRLISCQGLFAIEQKDQRT